MDSVLGKKALAKAERLLKASGMTLEELGTKMGYPAATARASVWQLFNKVKDPRLSSIESLAKALGVGVKDLL
jgi:transcriptional regulator with XRE-family HTH domain